MAFCRAHASACTDYEASFFPSQGTFWLRFVDKYSRMYTYAFSCLASPAALRSNVESTKTWFNHHQLIFLPKLNHYYPRESPFSIRIPLLSHAATFLISRGISRSIGLLEKRTQKFCFSRVLFSLCKQAVTHIVSLKILLDDISSELQILLWRPSFCCDNVSLMLT